MNRTRHLCPVDKCPGLRPAGTPFCHKHWKAIPSPQRYDIEDMARHGAFEFVRRVVGLWKEYFEAEARP